MTLLREPGTVHEAVRLALVIYREAELAKIVDREVSIVWAWSNPEDEREIPLPAASKIDARLVSDGYDPVFAPLLTRLAAAACPTAVAEAVPTPLAAVLSVAGTIGGALSTMAKAARDGVVNRSEIHGCLKATEALGVENAKCRRALFAALRRQPESAAAAPVRKGGR